jgi:hypothetical protein
MKLTSRDKARLPRLAALLVDRSLAEALTLLAYKSR